MRIGEGQILVLAVGKLDDAKRQLLEGTGIPVAGIIEGVTSAQVHGDGEDDMPATHNVSRAVEQEEPQSRSEIRGPLMGDGSDG